MIGEYLDTLDDRVGKMVARGRSEREEYRNVPATDLEASSAAIIRSALAGLINEGADVADVTALESWLRVAQVFPHDALTHSIQLAAREVMVGLIEVAERLEVPLGLMLLAHDIAGQFANAAAGS